MDFDENRTFNHTQFEGESDSNFGTCQQILFLKVISKKDYTVA